MVLYLDFFLQELNDLEATVAVLATKHDDNVHMSRKIKLLDAAQWMRATVAPLG